MQIRSLFSLLFSNEAQFQLKLGMVLQEGFPEWKVKLEAVSIAKPSPYFAEVEVGDDNLKLNYPQNKQKNADDSKTKIDKDDLYSEKIETDIVVESPGGTNNIAIELKYKNAEVNDLIYNSNKESAKGILYSKGSEKIPLFSQGAANIGAHEFLEDVERLERLIYEDGRGFKINQKHVTVNDKVTYGFSGKAINKGFAIIITNDKRYYEEGDSIIYKDFFFPENEKKEDWEKANRGTNKCRGFN